MSLNAAAILDTPDVLFLILRHLPLGDVARLRLVSKAWNKVIVDTHSAALWRGSYASFVHRVMTLTRGYRRFAARGFWDADFTLDIVRWVSIPRNQRLTEMLVTEGLMTEKQYEHVRQIIPREDDRTFDDYLVDNTGLIALRAKFINPDQISQKNASRLEEFFRSGNGIFALYERLITMDQVLAMPNSAYVHYLLVNPNGITALREGLITADQAMRLPSYRHLYHLFDDGNLGIIALREGLVTPVQLTNMAESEYVRYFLEGILTQRRHTRRKQDRARLRKRKKHKGENE